ncbi:hypothetical protein ACA910_016502 [Epithemia clementina (nom. ined.)]
MIFNLLIFALLANVGCGFSSQRPLVPRVPHGARNTCYKSTLAGKNLRYVTSLTTVSMPTAMAAPLLGRRDRLKSLWREFRSNPVWHWRLVFGSSLSLLLVFQRTIDFQLVGLWDYLLLSRALPARIFRTDSWEWCWAIFTIVTFIHGFGLADKLVRRADNQGRIHPWKKYRLQDRYEADKLRRIVQIRRSRGEDVVNELDDGKPLPVSHSRWHWQSWLFEFWVYAAPLIVWDIVAPRRHRRIGGFGPPTTMGILGGIVGALMLYDLLFFCGHYVMHKVPFLYRTFHAKHHHTNEIRACDQVRLTIGEEVYDVLCSIVALNVLGVHPVARSIYNMVITFLLVELHCGFDFPWTPQNVVPFGLVTGSRRHHYHHRFGRHYYQKFFFSVDRLFGFFQKDDGTLHGDSVKRNAYVPASWRTARTA